MQKLGASVTLLPAGELFQALERGVLDATEFSIPTSDLMALFYLKGVAPPEVTTTDIYKGVIPFILLQLTGLIVVFIWPELVTWLPGVAYK